MTKRRERETPQQLARRIIFEENTAIVPENMEWLAQRIAQAIEVDRAYGEKAAHSAVVQNATGGDGNVKKLLDEHSETT